MPAGREAWGPLPNTICRSQVSAVTVAGERGWRAFVPLLLHTALPKATMKGVAHFFFPAHLLEQTHKRQQKWTESPLMTC